MKSDPVRLRRTPWRLVKDAMHASQRVIGEAWGRPARGMRTNYTVKGLPVIFIHNPKTGGTSLGRLLGVTQRTHALPSQRIKEKYWLQTFSIVVVRDPFDRFLSCYYGNVVRPGENGLTKRYGSVIKELSPSEFLPIVLKNPQYGGSQANWTQYPSQQKPSADLILRYEDIENWKAVLIEYGLDVFSKELRHHNKSARGISEYENGFSERELDELREQVREAFWLDYRLFGYK